jgi:hypothetical protein
MKKLAFAVEWHRLYLEGTAFFYPGDPGRLSGPPEKCYPPEGAEVEILRLTADGCPAMFLMDSNLSDDIEAVVCEHLLDILGEEDESSEDN